MLLNFLEGNLYALEFSVMYLNIFDKFLINQHDFTIKTCGNNELFHRIFL